MDVSMLVIVLIGFLCSGAYAVIGYGLFAKGTRDQKAFGLVNASITISAGLRCLSSRDS